jgi:crotonobetainyl-CoA:carnitine CoA-transferase CaiB-like acyl-CoA transferase
MMARPFEGIRVIDVTHVLAGPFATYQLAVLGADVIKVEHPDDPDQSRGGGTDKALNRAQLGTSFLAQGSNKRAITLDLKTEHDRDILKKLVATADVFVENYRPGALAALGLGYEALSAINPRLIYASFSAFGGTGPQRQRTAYDHVIQATSGIMAMTGTKDVNPVMFGAPAIDYATGTTGAFALSAALFQRERSGRGQRIDMAMLDVAMILMSSHLAGYLRNGTHPKPHGNRHAHATNGAYETKDGLLMVGASNLRQQRRLWTVLERPDLIKRTNDERGRTTPAKPQCSPKYSRPAPQTNGKNSSRRAMSRRRGFAPWARPSPIRRSRAAASSTATPPRRASRATSAYRLRPSRSPMTVRASTRRRPRLDSTMRKFSRNWGW